MTVAIRKIGENLGDPVRRLAVEVRLFVPPDLCVRVQGTGSRATTSTVTTWASMTARILELRQHLLKEHVSLVVMEATSDYWRPFYYLLEDDEPKSGRGFLVVALVALALVAGLGYLRWRDGGLPGLKPKTSTSQTAPATVPNPADSTSPSPAPEQQNPASAPSAQPGPAAPAAPASRPWRAPRRRARAAATR